MLNRTAILTLILSLIPSAQGVQASDTYVIRVDEAVAGDLRPGRLMLFFITETGWRWDRAAPMDGPFFSKPQPIASIDLADLAVNLSGGEPVEISVNAMIASHDLEALNQRVRVQAVLDSDRTKRSHTQGPGNLYSDSVAVELTAGTDDRVELTLNQRVERATMPADTDRIRWVEFRSHLLSSHFDREVMHRAGVILPAGWSEETTRRWPAVYVVPGYGGTHLGAQRYQRRARGDAAYIVLDADAPLGHHGFVDSPGNGPRGRALVSELIPYLDATFNLATEPSGRAVTGHSSGGWSSLWLQLQHPKVFGACWSSAPDPVDFSAFQVSDLYSGANIYVDVDGAPVPSMRRTDAEGMESVLMTVGEEARMEWAMHPLGGSGQQWDAWEAMFSPLDPETGYPKPMFNAATGAIDHDTVEQWARYDITRMVTEDWDRYGPIVMQRVRLMCGTRDSFYLDRAVANFKSRVESLAEAGGGWSGDGYIELVEGADHGSIGRHTVERWSAEMAVFLEGAVDARGEAP